MDELEHLYEQLESDKGERLQLMSAIGDPNVCFPDDDVDEISEDEGL
jgi:hypothetical protein